MPSVLHLDMDVVALPVGPGHLPARDVTEILVVVHVRPEADGAAGPGALAAIDVLLREHGFVSIGLTYILLTIGFLSYLFRKSYICTKHSKIIWTVLYFSSRACSAK